MTSRYDLTQDGDRRKLDVAGADWDALEAEIRGFCEGKIAHFKIPRYIRFVDEFPMTVTGKVQKFAMRERVIEELAAAVKRSA